MALANGLRFIWLDTYIGIMGEYQKLKEKFGSNLRPILDIPSDANIKPISVMPSDININELIGYFEENVAPIEFVSKTEDALALIDSEKDKRIKFISSGTLGQPVIPTIVSSYPRVDYFYIFCGYVRSLREWALEHDYDTCMKILDHERPSSSSGS